MSAPDPDAPTQRILAVIDVVSSMGPITLAQLTEALPFSRAAIWRAVDTLRAAGWLRMRPGDNAFELRAAMLERLSNGHKSNPLIESVAPLFDQLACLGPFHLDLGGFVDTGVFRILQTTRKDTRSVLDQPVSLVDDDLAKAAQLSVSPPQLVVHLRAFMVFATDEERRTITSGEHGRSISKQREKGHIWLDDHSAVAFALPDHPGVALRAELWRMTKLDISTFKSTLTTFMGSVAPTK
ncbi:MAG: HTH domain-containing protein [Cypionkella sp.]|nr:HTH domain-containing protein [Cypionkella sp.]